MNNIYDIKTLTEVFVKNEGGEIVHKLDGRYGQVGTVVKVRDRNYYLFYKKEWFITFSRFFPKFKGVGIGISMKHIDLASATDGIIVLFVVGKEYRIEAKLFKDFVEKNNTRKYFDKDNELIGNVPASFLEDNMFVKQTIDSQVEKYMH